MMKHDSTQSFVVFQGIFELRAVTCRDDGAFSLNADAEGWQKVEDGAWTSALFWQSYSGKMRLSILHDVRNI